VDRGWSERPPGAGQAFASHALHDGVGDGSLRARCALTANRALRDSRGDATIASGSGLAAITLTELNPHNAAVDAGLLERFAASFAQAIGYRVRLH
jgi:hypothetical protein